MAPKRKPGPRPAPKVKTATELARSHVKIAYPFLINFMKYHVQYDAAIQVQQYVHSADMHSNYRRWISRMGDSVLSQEQRVRAGSDIHILSFIKQLLEDADMRAFWDTVHGRGPFKFVCLHRNTIDQRRLSIKGFVTIVNPNLDLPVERRPSTIPNAGHGMFSKRCLFEGEMLCEYDGTLQVLTQAAFDGLQRLHQNDGNGLIDLTSGRTLSGPNPKRRANYTVLNPYLIQGQARTSITAPAVWANHAREGREGCSLKLVSNAKFGLQRKLYLTTRCLIPADTELRWDYGVRDPATPWM